jgi:hypothetical protein
VEAVTPTVSDDRIVVPRGQREPRDRPFQPDAVDNARLLKALQQMDENADKRTRDLFKLLIFLPLIWGVISFVLYFLYLVLGGALG